MDALLAEIIEHYEVHNRKKTAFVDALKPRLGELFVPILAKGTKINSFSFQAYQPGYSDGDATSYNIYADEPNINTGEDDEEDGYTVASSWAKRHIVHLKKDAGGDYIRNVDGSAIIDYLEPNPEFDPINGAVYEEIVNLLSQIPEEVLIEILDQENVEVTIDRTGKMTIDEYNVD